MDNTLYIGLSRQMTLQRSLDVVANNLANVDTIGFKVESLIVETDEATPRSLPATQPLRYVIDRGVGRNFGQGPLQQTGGALDVAIEGNAFFAVNTPDGPRYTRDGRFAIDAQNQLVDKQGNTVQAAGGGVITLDPKTHDVSIAKDGTVSQGGKSVGRLGAVRFANLAGLKKEGGNLYSSDEVPASARDAQLHGGMIEGSNVQPITEITSMIEITRAYERLNTMMNQTEDLSTRAVDRLGKAA